MKVQKSKIVDLPMVYVTAELRLDGRRYLAAASEARGERAYLIDPRTSTCTDLWLGETGVMNIVQIPGENRLLAITRFYPIFQSKDAAICLLEPTEKGLLAPWKITEVLKLPFCHRIGVVRNDSGLFLFACQLCADKAFQEDWSQPGALWTAPIPKTADAEWKLTRLSGGLTKNHGLFIENENQVYVSSQNGVMRFDMRRYRAGESMGPEIISTEPTSDICVSQEEDGRAVGAIEPFHGDRVALYRMTDAGYEKVADFAGSFVHVVWTGRIFGRSALIVGNRGGRETLELRFWRTDETVTLDTGVGPTQITVYEDGNRVRILSANHGSGDVSLYTLTE